MNALFSQGRPRPGQFCLYKGQPCINLGTPAPQDTGIAAEEREILVKSPKTGKWNLPPELVRLGLLDRTGWQHVKAFVVRVVDPDLAPMVQMDQIPEERRAHIMEHNPHWRPLP